jgi:hypothetical protein
MRYDWIIWLVLLVGAIAFLATSALGADRPFLSKSHACWKVRAAVASFGEAALEPCVGPD